VRRASAISLLVAMCFSSIATIAFADPESNLPQCCRRNGQHHCAMDADDAVSSTAGVQSIRTTCPEFPVASVAPSTLDAAVLKGAITISASVLSHPASPVQAEARYRVSFSRSRQKRGPPVILS
jgi:hypothetical protein